MPTVETVAGKNFEVVAYHEIGLLDAAVGRHRIVDYRLMASFLRNLFALGCQLEILLCLQLRFDNLD